MALVVKNLPANAGDARHTVLKPGSGRSSGRKWATCSITLPEKIPWTEEPEARKGISKSRTQLSTLNGM